MNAIFIDGPLEGQHKEIKPCVGYMHPVMPEIKMAYSLEPTPCLNRFSVTMVAYTLIGQYSHDGTMNNLSAIFSIDKNTKLRSKGPLAIIK
jgi:hypothetical protein